MSEKEREVDSSEAPASTTDPDRSTGDGSSIDDVEYRRADDLDRERQNAEVGAESFVSLETELRREGDGPSLQTPTYARVVDARKVDPTAVPNDYPHTIRTDPALAIDLVLDEESGTKTTAFFDWPPDDDRLGRLLDVAGIGYDTFADLNGTEVLVDHEGGYYLPLIPPSGSTGSSWGYPGLLAGHGLNAALLGALALGLASSGSWLTVFLLITVLNLLVIPLATYVDARRLLTRTSWNQGPGFWAFLSMVPLGNVFVTAAYLWTRRRADPLTRS